MTKQKTKIQYDALKKRMWSIVIDMLRNSDGGVSFGDLASRVWEIEEKKIPADLRVEYEENGVAKWRNFLHSNSHAYVKADFIQKTDSGWHLTPAGIKALEQGEQSFAEQAKVRRNEWNRMNRERKNTSHLLLKESAANLDSDNADSEEVLLETRVEEYQTTAMSSIERHIHVMSPYQFQDLCAALLRGMGYHVRKVSKQGEADGGIDVLAYADPLGAPPCVKVQVKHTSAPVNAPSIRELAGVVNPGDIGLYVSLSGFVRGCDEAARKTGKHLELVNLTRFINLWWQHYNKMSEEDKSLLPLQAIYFLDEKRARGHS